MSNPLVEVIQIVAESFGHFFDLLGGLPWSGGGQSMIWILELGGLCFIIWLLDGGRLGRKEKTEDEYEWIRVRRRR